MIIDGFHHQLPDLDPEETQEWLEALDQIVDEQGSSRARFLMAKLIERAQELQVGSPQMVSTPYLNTIPPEDQPFFPGEQLCGSTIRGNGVAVSHQRYLCRLVSRDLGNVQTTGKGRVCGGVVGRCCLDIGLAVWIHLLVGARTRT